MFFCDFRPDLARSIPGAGSGGSVGRPTTTAGCWLLLESCSQCFHCSSLPWMLLSCFTDKHIHTCTWNPLAKTMVVLHAKCVSCISFYDWIHSRVMNAKKAWCVIKFRAFVLHSSTEGTQQSQTSEKASPPLLYGQFHSVCVSRAYFKVQMHFR